MNKKLLVLFGLLLSAAVSFADNSPTSNSETQQRIFMLETALAPTHVHDVVTTWAEAAKNRNGAVQFMLLCPDLQKKNLSKLEALNWVTGISSPWISSYKVTSQYTTKANTWKFSIEYKLSAGGAGKGWIKSDTITVIPVKPDTNSSQQWCISGFDYLSPVDQLK